MMFGWFKRAMEPEVKLNFEMGKTREDIESEIEEKISAAREDWNRRAKIAVEELEARTPKFAVKQDAASGDFYVAKMSVSANPALGYGDSHLGAEHVISVYNEQATAVARERFLLDRNQEVALFKTKPAALAALKRWADPEVTEYDHPPLVERKKENNQ